MKKNRVIFLMGIFCMTIFTLTCDKSTSVSVATCEEKTSCLTTVQNVYDDNGDLVGTEDVTECSPNPASLGCAGSDNNCSSCNPNASIQQASLSLQGGQTCPVTTTSSDTFKTPGCWCHVPFVGDRCCFCGGGNCYTTVTTTNTTYVPAPVYGSCP